MQDLPPPDHVQLNLQIAASSNVLVCGTSTSWGKKSVLYNMRMVKQIVNAVLECMLM